MALAVGSLLEKRVQTAIAAHFNTLRMQMRHKKAERTLRERILREAHHRRIRLEDEETVHIRKERKASLQF